MWRLRLLLAFFAVWFFLILARLFHWQVLSHRELSQAADSQQLMRLEIPARRGEILSADGSPLVTNQPAYLVYVEPKKIKDNQKVEAELARILEIDKASISAKLDSDFFWVPISHKVDQPIVDRLSELGIDGLGFEPEEKRFYPEGSMSAHLLGFVGASWDGNPRGYFGLEGYYNRELKGRPGFLQQAKSASGDPILAGLMQRLKPEDGRTLKLHLDRTVQFLVEKELHQGIIRYGAQGGDVVIINPKDGGVIAMASEPSYDPSIFAQFQQELYKNPVVSESFEPGSIFKVIVMAAALEEGVVDKDTFFDESGPVSVGGYLIRTWNNQYSGQITATQILEKSSNVGMVQVAQRLGQEKLFSYIEKFGFGQETEIDLAEETSPGLRPKDQWREIDLATSSFGQGIAVTPIQMVRAVAAIANGGHLFEPQVVDKIVTPTGQEIDIKPKLTRTVISSVTARVLTEMMVRAVENGEAQFARPRGYRIAGKTGTAQIPVAGHYESEKTIASFIGFAPADKPRFVMLVTLRQPTSSPWGSETAAPLFFSIAEKLLSYYNIAPSEATK